MLGSIQSGREPDFRALLAVSLVAIGVALCLYAFHLLPGWQESVAHMNLWQQLAAFIQSEFLASVVLTMLWLGRLLALRNLTRHHDRLVRYRAMRRGRKLAASGISSLLATAASFWALLLTFELHPIAALLPAVIVFGGAMGWLESRIAFGQRTTAIHDPT